MHDVQRPVHPINFNYISWQSSKFEFSFNLHFPFQVLKFNLTESGLLCVLPWLTMAIFANIGGWIADTLVTRGYSITTVRKARTDTDWNIKLWFRCWFSPVFLFTEDKLLQIHLMLQIMQSIGFLGPAFFLTQLSRVKTPAMAVLCMACSQVEALLSNTFELEISRVFPECGFGKYFSLPLLLIGSWCVLTIWTLFKSPRHWTSL